MNARFRARISDPIGPRWTRLLVPTLATTTLILDYLWAALDSASPGPAFFVAALLLLFARPLLGRHRSRNCELVLTPGKVQVRDAGLLNQTIETGDVSGASTSVGEDGNTIVAVARSGRMGRPLHFEVDSTARASEIRQALGIGYGGYGTLAWKLSGSSFELYTNLARIVGGVTALLMAYGAATEADNTLLTWFLLVLAMAWVYLGPFLRQDASLRNGTLWFNEAGLFYGKGGKTQHIPYADLADVHADERFLRIQRGNVSEAKISLYRASHSLNGASALEIAHITAQIRDAARRARGEVEAADGTVGGVEMLMRNAADAPRTWLERLDATATTMGGGYRSVNLTKEALVRTLEDPDAAPDVRVGAARVLYRIASDETTARVADVCETVRDPALRKQLRVVLTDDMDDAVAELAMEDAKMAKPG
jgi:hypothetical protein